MTELSWRQRGILDDIHALAQVVIGSARFNTASLQPTSATDHGEQRALLLYRESDYVGVGEFTVLGALPSFTHRRRDLAFYVAADGHIYYGYCKPYRPTGLAEWSVRQLHESSPLPTTRIEWIRERLVALSRGITPE